MSQWRERGLPFGFPLNEGVPGTQRPSQTHMGHIMGVCFVERKANRRKTTEWVMLQGLAERAILRG